jgi:hypothetical protein
VVFKQTSLFELAPMETSVKNLQKKIATLKPLSQLKRKELYEKVKPRFILNPSTSTSGARSLDWHEVDSAGPFRNMQASAKENSGTMPENTYGYINTAAESRQSLFSASQGQMELPSIADERIGSLEPNSFVVTHPFQSLDCPMSLESDPLFATNSPLYLHQVPSLDIGSSVHLGLANMDPDQIDRSEPASLNTLPFSPKNPVCLAATPVVDPARCSARRTLKEILQTDINLSKFHDEILASGLSDADVMEQAEEDIAQFLKEYFKFGQLTAKKFAKVLKQG